MLPHGNKLEKWLNSDFMHEIIAFLIIINAIVLGLETYTFRYCTLLIRPY